jgi:Flp pilus assembly protein TadB
MPAATGTILPPPKKCPICRERIWSREDVTNIHQAATLYNVHVHTNHSEYEGWNRKVSWAYLISIALFIIAPLLATMVSSADAARLLISLSWALAFATLVIVPVIKNRGRRRFRELWNEEHGAPVNPV